MRVSLVCVLVLAVWGRAAGQLRHCLNETREAPAASPYWADHGGRPLVPPDVTIADLEAPPRQCSTYIRPCVPSDRYRITTGHCNNLRHHFLGAADTPLTRLLDPVYDEAFMRTRGVDGCLLPNPRRVSVQLHHSSAKYEDRFSTLFMQVGQFIDHDLVLAMTVDEAVKSGECSDCEAWHNPICAPIPIPEDDPFFPATHAQSGQRRCLPFVRSLGRWLPNRRNRKMLRHINVNSAFLDLSTVYGSDPCREEELRSKTGGYLLESFPGLPPLVDANRFVECRMNFSQCFLAGDDRANEHLGLLVLHSLYLREHNRIAKVLGSLNTHWDDERIYQEARRINIAQYQRMIYYEFLPYLIGRQKVRQLGFNTQWDGYYEGYQNNTDPSLLEEFVTAIFRVGHTMIPNILLLVAPDYRSFSIMPLMPTFHNPSDIMQSNIYDEVMRGMLRARLEGIDLKLADGVTNRLFQLPNDTFSGQDLMVLNIARGRDHAIAPYVDYLNMCERINVTTFRDLSKYIKPDVLANLGVIYKDVRDVDLIVGSLAEISGRKSMVGPTMRCIIGMQFQFLKQGDRFWFENRSAGFTPEQLTSLRRSSLARVVCDSMQGPDAKVPTRALKRKKSGNTPKRCSELTGTDLRLWQEPGSRATTSTCSKESVFNHEQTSRVLWLAWAREGRGAATKNSLEWWQRQQGRPTRVPLPVTGPPPATPAAHHTHTHSTSQDNASRACRRVECRGGPASCDPTVRLQEHIRAGHQLWLLHLLYLYQRVLPQDETWFAQGRGDDPLGHLPDTGAGFRVAIQLHDGRVLHAVPGDHVCLYPGGQSPSLLLHHLCQLVQPHPFVRAGNGFQHIGVCALLHLVVLPVVGCTYLVVAWLPPDAPVRRVSRHDRRLHPRTCAGYRAWRGCMALLPPPDRQTEHVERNLAEERRWERKEGTG